MEPKTDDLMDDHLAKFEDAYRKIYGDVLTALYTQLTKEDIGWQEFKTYIKQLQRGTFAPANIKFRQFLASIPAVEREFCEATWTELDQDMWGAR